MLFFFGIFRIRSGLILFMMEELLHILEKNARLPVEDIAAMMGKTPAQVATMMDEAVAKGYIRGFEAMIDWEQAGINVVEAVIELHVSPRKSRGLTRSHR